MERLSVTRFSLRVDVPIEGRLTEGIRTYDHSNKITRVTFKKKTNVPIQVKYSYTSYKILKILFFLTNESLFITE